MGMVRVHNMEALPSQLSSCGSEPRPCRAAVSITATAAVGAPPWLRLMRLAGSRAAASAQPGGHLIDGLQPHVSWGRGTCPAAGGAGLVARGQHLAGYNVSQGRWPGVGLTPLAWRRRARSIRRPGRGGCGAGFEPGCCSAGAGLRVRGKLVEGAHGCGEHAVQPRLAVPAGQPARAAGAGGREVKSWVTRRAARACTLWGPGLAMRRLARDAPVRRRCCGPHRLPCTSLSSSIRRWKVGLRSSQDSSTVSSCGLAGTKWTCAGGGQVGAGFGSKAAVTKAR